MALIEHARRSGVDGGHQTDGQGVGPGHPPLECG